MGLSPPPVLALLLLGAAVTVGRPRGRILGGSEAQPHGRPYMASLRRGGQHVCGGFLIAPRWVLSAAHCAREGSSEALEVLLGAHSLSEPEPPKRLYGVRAQVPHPGSNARDNKDDLLLLQLEEEAELSAAVGVLRFQRVDREVAAGTACSVAGWGTVSHSGRRPDRLIEVERPVISRDVCNHRTRHDGAVTEKMMCTDSQRKDTCQGDSGGPLVCGGVAEGVVTAGSRVCGNYKKPAIYTRIAPYAAWIDRVTASAGGEGAAR
ncbi:complement factor D-like [Rhynochetos jubatus]